MSLHVQRNDPSLEWRLLLRTIVETIIDSNRHIACVLVIPNV